MLPFFFFEKNENNFVGLGVKIRVGRVTGNQQLFFGVLSKVALTISKFNYK
jgi:hypothetical protein